MSILARVRSFISACQVAAAPRSTGIGRASSTGLLEASNPLPRSGGRSARANATRMELFRSKRILHPCRFGGLIQGILEVELTGHLNFAWIVHSGTHFAEGRRITHTGRRVGE